MGSWSFASSQRGLAASPLLIGIGGSRRGDFLLQCGLVWASRVLAARPTLACLLSLPRACPAGGTGLAETGPVALHWPPACFFQLRSGSQVGQGGGPGRAPAHSPGARRDFWLSGIAHLQVAANPAAAPECTAHQRAEGSHSRATAAGLRQHSDRLFALHFFLSLPAARFDVGDGRPHATPCHANSCSGQGDLSRAVQDTSLGSGMSSWRFAVVCSGLGLG